MGMNVCIYKYLYVCIYACRHTYLCVHPYSTYMHGYVCVFIYACVYMYIGIHGHMSCMFLHKFICIHIYTCMFACYMNVYL